MANKNGNLTIGPDQNVPTSQAIILGLQHVLAMDVYVPPFIIATSLALSSSDASELIQSTFLGAGLATLVQVLFFMKLPVCQGPSFVPIGAIIGIYLGTSGKMGSVLGACLVGAIIVTLFGFLGVYQWIVKTFIPPLVSGTIITIVGLSLIPSALKDNIYTVTKNGPSLSQNITLAIITGITLIFCSMISDYLPKWGKFFRIASVIIALFVGCVFASFMGVLNLSSVSSAPLFSIPHIAFINYHLSFSWSTILTMLIIYMVLLAETTGTWFAVSSVIDEPLSDKQINHGVIGEGVGCILAALGGATPVTGYSTNAGVISITGVASRKVFVFAGVWFVILSFIGKLSALINAIPAAVIGGVFAIVTIIIMLSGFRVIKNYDFNEREMYVVGIPLVFALALIFLPSSATTHLPQFLKFLFDSPVAIGAIIAIIMNKVLPEKNA